MNFFKNIFGKKDEPIKSKEDFWNWFVKNERVFYNSVRGRVNIESAFLDRLSAKLNELKDGYYFLTGMSNENTAELIFSAEGVIKNIVFVEQLVKAAPELNGWLFTALKPAGDIEEMQIEMSGYNFDSSNLYFYPNELPGYPDEIDITLVHDELNEKNKEVIGAGTFIFIDNYLGELASITMIDNAAFVEKRNALKELVPISKLRDFLTWREKEFIEKYEGIWHNTENDQYNVLQGAKENGNPIIAVVNTDVLEWNSKPSHPWILTITMGYDGKTNNGMPDNKAVMVMDGLEEKINEHLKPADGYLNIGRETGGNIRTIYFACKDFRKPSILLYGVQKFAKFVTLDYDIYKDKYWRTFDRFIPPVV